MSFLALALAITISRYRVVVVVTILVILLVVALIFFCFKQKTAYEMRISDWSSDVCSSDLPAHLLADVDYGGPVVAAVGRDNLVGTQFHPEKSQAVEIGRASCRERVCQYV